MMPCSPCRSPHCTPHHTQPGYTPHDARSQAMSPMTPHGVPHHSHDPWQRAPHPAPPLPTSKASPVKSLAQNSHLTRRLGQPCWTCSGRSRRLSLALHRLGQGMTLKPQVPRWAWGGGHRDSEGQPWGTALPPPPPHPAGPYLEVLDEPGPAAALLAVDAADGQTQHLRLQLWVRVDLGRRHRDAHQHPTPGCGGAGIPHPSLARSRRHVARGWIPPAGTRTSTLCRERVSVPRPGGTKGSCFHMGARARPARLCQAGVRSAGPVPWRGGTSDGNVPSERGTPSTCRAHLGIVQGQLVLRALEDAFAARHREGSGPLGAGE